jgi:hypothetical protein
MRAKVCRASYFRVGLAFFNVARPAKSCTCLRACVAATLFEISLNGLDPSGDLLGASSTGSYRIVIDYSARNVDRDAEPCEHVLMIHKINVSGHCGGEDGGERLAARNWLPSPIQFIDPSIANHTARASRSRRLSSEYQRLCIFDLPIF